MGRIKDLEARVEALETELHEQLKEKRCTRFIPFTYYGRANAHFTVTEPTMRAQVDAILDHLGITVKAVEEETIEAHIEVKKPIKATTKPAKKAKKTRR